MKPLTLAELTVDDGMGETTEKMVVKSVDTKYKVEKTIFGIEPEKMVKTCGSGAAVVLALGDKMPEGDVLVPAYVIDLLSELGRQDANFKGVSL